MKVAIIILNIVIVILIVSFRSYFSEKTKNLATLEDIRKISMEEHSGKLEAEAKKETIAAITKTDTGLERLSLQIALDAVQQKEKFQEASYRTEMFSIWTSLISELDKNVIILPKEIQKEVVFLREEWPHIIGGSEKIKWCGDLFVTVLMKRATIQAFRKRMQEVLTDSQKKFNYDEAKRDYDMKELLKQTYKMQENIRIEMIGYAVSKEEIENMFPGTKISMTITDSVE